ncbi:hypothetical protein LC612_28500 [Nostoc sp. CHAB 5834]|nr:hypothetical protein [Nostoc sp. CHAB 5834]
MKSIVLKYLGAAVAVPILLYASFVAFSGSGVAETFDALTHGNNITFKEPSSKPTVLEHTGDVPVPEFLDDELELPATKGYLVSIRIGLEVDELQTTVEVNEGACPSEEIFKGRQEWTFKVDDSDNSKKVVACIRAAVDGLPAEVVNREGVWTPLSGTGDLNDAVTVLAQDISFKDELGTPLTLTVLSSSWCSENLDEGVSAPHCTLNLSMEAVPLGAVPTLPLLTAEGKVRRHAFTGS